MPRSDVSIGLNAAMTHQQRREHASAARAVVVASLDFPVLPTSAVDPAPHVPEESGDNLSPGQRLAVAALVCGHTYVAAAREAGVTRRTLYAWRQEPAFRRAVEGTSREAMAAVIVRVRNLMLRATRVLGEAMTDDERGPQHAFRVLNSSRLWTAATEGAEEEDEAPDVTPTRSSPAASS